MDGRYDDPSLGTSSNGPSDSPGDSTIDIMDILARSFKDMLWTLKGRESDCIVTLQDTLLDTRYTTRVDYLDMLIILILEKNIDLTTENVYDVITAETQDLILSKAWLNETNAMIGGGSTNVSFFEYNPHGQEHMDIEIISNSASDKNNDNNGAVLEGELLIGVIVLSTFCICSLVSGAVYFFLSKKKNNNSINGLAPEHITVEDNEKGSIDKLKLKLEQEDEQVERNLDLKILEPDESCMI
jgi:hypothetical protein